MKPLPYSKLPVSEPVFYILLSLASGRKHGYAILKDVETMSQEALLLSTSTLYSALGRLEEQGLIRRVPAGSPAGEHAAPGEAAPGTPGLPRKVYELTPQGLALLQGEADRLHRMAAIARRSLAKRPA